MGAITYRKYKALGLCPRCGKYHTGGKACDKCKEKHRLYIENRKINMSEEEYQSIVEAERFNSLYRYKQLKEKGICTRCGKTKVKNGYTNCSMCRKLHTSKQKTRYKNQRIREKEMY